MLHTSPPLLPSRRQALGAGLAAALGSWAALELLEGRLARASTARSAGQVSVVGDSLTHGTLRYQADALSEVGWTHTTIDAHISRGVITKIRTDPHTGLIAVDAIRAESGDSDLWVVALGTNDAGIHPRNRHKDLIRRMMDRIGGGHHVLWVNIYLPATPPRQEAWNSALHDVAEDRPDGDVRLRLGVDRGSEPTVAQHRSSALHARRLQTASTRDRVCDAQPGALDTHRHGAAAGASPGLTNGAP